MVYSYEEFDYIYYTNNAYCWLCEKKLGFINYGKVDVMKKVFLSTPA
jgi:hypothetical protein